MIMIGYFAIQSSIIFGFVPYRHELGVLLYGFFLAFIAPFYLFSREFLDKKKRTEEIKKELEERADYIKVMNDTFISLSRSEDFYEGHIEDVAVQIPVNITCTIKTDRASIWLYNKDKTSIKCQKLYVAAEDKIYEGTELFKKDFAPYFYELEKNTSIVANDAEYHPATSCFTDVYLKPLGIRSMLDVPIFYQDEVIGVICIESLDQRNWDQSEIIFANQLSSIYSFAYTMNEKNILSIETNTKNSYLEHAAKIIRHDMHSGINTYIPRGITSLERRLTPEAIKQLKLESPLKLLKEGLEHTQKVYRGVYEFTNLVKPNAELDKEEYSLRRILTAYLDNTSYKDQVAIDWLPSVPVNEPLFCTAIDNLIRNGLKYNDSEFKMVAISMEDETHMIIQDNGRGMTQEEFDYFCKPYTRKEGQSEKGTGLGLNICVAILKEHGFTVSCEKNEHGTKMKIKIR